MPGPASVDAYIAAQPPETQTRLRELRAIIREAVPGATELISYGMPTYKLGRARVHFGAAKGHCSLYGAPLADFADDLRGYETGRGTIRFRLHQPISADLVRRLVLAKLERPT
jgi:uncharacterized protein YdhG (YjbR/CyaY superfamily)